MLGFSIGFRVPLGFVFCVEFTAYSTCYQMQVKSYKATMYKHSVRTLRNTTHACNFYNTELVLTSADKSFYTKLKKNPNTYWILSNTNWKNADFYRIYKALVLRLITPTIKQTTCTYSTLFLPLEIQDNRQCLLEPWHTFWKSIAKNTRTHSAGNPVGKTTRCRIGTRERERVSSWSTLLVFVPFAKKKQWRSIGVDGIKTLVHGSASGLAKRWSGARHRPVGGTRHAHQRTCPQAREARGILETRVFLLFCGQD